MQDGRRNNHPKFLVLLALVASFSVLAGEREDPAERFWPAWRGPFHTGVAPHGRPPVTWAESENVRWKTALPGPGHGSPIVWGDRVFVLAAVLGEETAAPAPEPRPTERGEPRPTPSSSSRLPVQDRGALLAAAMQPPSRREQRPSSERGRQRRTRRPPPPRPTRVHRFTVLAYERATGKLAWETVVAEEVPHEPGHPTASQASASAVTDGEHLYAFFGSRGLFCLDMAGKVRWHVDLGDMRTRNEFGEGASPALHGDTIVVNWDHEGDSFIVALNKRTGDQRWRVARDEPTSWSTPLILKDGERELVVVSATNGVRAYDLKSGAEVWSVAGLGLNCIPMPVADDRTVFVMSGYRDAAALAIRYPGARGALAADRVVWRLDRNTSYVPSPLLYDGKLYFLEQFRAMLSSYDLATGGLVYDKQRIEGLGNIYASPVGADGKIYLVGRDGNAVVFARGPNFEVLSRNRLDDAFDASPAIAGDELYLRGHENLYCLARKTPG